MKRRKFFEASGVLGLSSLLPSLQEKDSSLRDFDMGYQLFSIRDRMATAPIETLQYLKSYGYSHFEIYGYNPADNSIYNHTPKELRSKLDDMGLYITSGHYGFSDYFMKSDDELLRFVDACYTCATALGSKYITWPWLDPRLRNMESYKAMVPKLNLIGSHLKGSEIQFAYHNHGFEFIEHNGETGYDLILNGTDPDLVKLQVDMYWVMHSSMNTTPKKLAQDHPGRFVMWHIKDMDVITRDYTELGNGSINYLNVLPTPQESGLKYYYIEQGGNFAINSLESAKASAEYCKQYL